MKTFKVTAETPAGPLSVRRETASAALETGRVLEQEGIGTVTITPPAGEVMTLAEFARAIGVAADGPLTQTANAPA